MSTSEVEIKMSTSIRSAVRKFIEENFLFQIGEQTLADDQSLLDVGVVDSTGVLELVAFLEGTFQIQIADKDLTPQNLDTIQAIATFVERKLPLAAAA
jgi:acyl carrier protein